jgi:uncharacterized membrane protein
MSVTNKESEKKYLLDRPRFARGLLVLFLLVAFGTLGLDLFIERHVEHPFERLVGFYGIWGFVSCVVLVLAARKLRNLVMRDEDHYDD